MKFPDQFRSKSSGTVYDTKDGDPFGMFVIPSSASSSVRALKVIANDGLETGWDHVSVSLFGDSQKCPSWNEMCRVKELFWDDDECIVQFHPAKSDHINLHNGCLHLWKYVHGEFPTPPKICV